jgi:regulator of protease activity HflC (stomatin/prohibitin superfamily)
VLAQAELDKQGADYLAGNRSGISLDSWQKIEGIKIPTAVIERYEADADAERVKRIEKLKKELAELEAKKPAKAKKTG